MTRITTLDPTSTSHNTKTILAQDGFKCSILTLAPGDETPRRNADQDKEHFLFLLEGEATVRFDHVNTILAKEQVLLVHKEQEYVITAHPGGLTKILRLDIPPRQIVTPQIIALPR